MPGTLAQRMYPAMRSSAPPAPTPLEQPPTHLSEQDKSVWRGMQSLNADIQRLKPGEVGRLGGLMFVRKADPGRALAHRIYPKLR
jgi:hypothetical protein